MDEGHYRPITEQEFDLLKLEIPHIAKLFENEEEIAKMKIPEIDESIPVQYHWEKVAFKMINNLWKN